MLYLTFNEAPSGIFSSQVTEVVKFLNEQHKEKVKLLCFISLRNYFGVRKQIKNELAGARVLPMFPTMRLWKLNRFTLYFFLLFSSHKKIMGRSVWATWFALKARNLGLVKKVIYDGRGAVYHESLEYKVISDQKLAEEIREIEKKCILESDFLLAVSEKLLVHWQTFYSFNKNNFVVIPCTVPEHFFEKGKNQAVADFSNDLNKSCVVGVYSGSLAGWQSVKELKNCLRSFFQASEKFNLLVLSKESPDWLELQKEFKGRIRICFVKPTEVKDFLQMADYGFLLREHSVTNKVASPVKFAEYLSAGLKVLISDGLGDFSEFVVKNNCGFVISGTSYPVLEKILPEEKSRMTGLAKNNFAKEKFREKYLQILSV